MTELKFVDSFSSVRGFNYQPSYGTSGLELWRKFDAITIREELGRGKRFFPGMNAIRLWLSHDAWLRDRSKFEADFDTALSIAGELGLAVMPVLFNRWHSTELDYGGIYIDHFLPRACWVQAVDQTATFVETIVGAHATDRRIFCWDICNEPFAYECHPSDIPEISDAETAWLARMAELIRAANATAPITVGTHPVNGLDDLKRVEPFCDVLGIHPYLGNVADVAKFEKLLDEYVAYAAQVGKPLIASECCWGSVDDTVRVELIRGTLDNLKPRKIGWLAYILHHSLIADSHREEFGPLGLPGNLAFIEADGSLRPGHGIFNDY
ncbi:MAG TPA: cellulase family glycosylhydrolase [Capsulimonadaceae bacterium]|jgi:hypothetical protein